MGWLFRKSEIQNSPSIQKGLPLETEERYRREGVQFIIDLKLQMGLSLSTMATAAIYFHRFYMVQSFQEFPRYSMACACVFLAGKVEETPKKCRDLVMCSKEMLPEERFAQFGADLKSTVDNLITLEKILLQAMKFHVEFDHPYDFVLKYTSVLKGDERRLGKMQQMAWKITHDSWCTTICLRWEPELIAIAVIHLACKLSKFEVTDWANRTEDHVNWWDQFVEDLSVVLVDYICHKLLDNYSLPATQTMQMQPLPQQSIVPFPPHLYPVSSLPIQSPAMMSAMPSPVDSYGHPTPKMYSNHAEYITPPLTNFPGMHAWPGCVDIKTEPEFYS